MAKQAKETQETQQSLAVGKGKSNALPTIASRQELLQEAFSQRGIAWTGEFDAPAPDILETFGVKELCVDHTEVKGAEKQSKMFWKLAEPKLQPSTKEGTKMFFVVEVFHEDWGPILLTGPGVYPDDTLGPVYEWVKDDVAVGGVFRLGSFGTSSGNTIIRPIPVA